MSFKKFGALIVIVCCLVPLLTSCAKKGAGDGGGEAPLSGSFIILRGVIAYEDGREPASMGQNDMYNFTNLQIVIELGKEKIRVPAVVKKMNGKYYFGSQIVTEKSPAIYRKINQITFSSEGYKTVSLKNITITNGSADFGNLVLRKK